MIGARTHVKIRAVDRGVAVDSPERAARSLEVAPRAVRGSNRGVALGVGARVEVELAGSASVGLAAEAAEERGRPRSEHHCVGRSG